MRYYTQPLSFFALTHGREFRCVRYCESRKFSEPVECPVCGNPVREIIITCSLQQSIAQRIHLILITNFNEFRYDNQFGCIIWETDFENIYNINQWKDRMARAVKDEIERYEPRLQNIKSILDLTEEEFQVADKKIYRRIKRRVDIKIQASVKKTNEPFYFQELLYVSPVWID